MREVHSVARTGRPKSENKSERRIGVRLTEEEYQHLQQYVDTHDLTMSQAIKLALDMLYHLEK